MQVAKLQVEEGNRGTQAPAGRWRQSPRASTRGGSIASTRRRVQPKTTRETNDGRRRTVTERTL